MENNIEQFFTAIQEDHRRLDEQVNRLEEKVDKGFREGREEMNLRFRAVDNQLEQMETKFDDKLDRINDNVQVIAAMLQARQTEFNQLDRRVTKLEQVHT